MSFLLTSSILVEKAGWCAWWWSYHLYFSLPSVATNAWHVLANTSFKVEMNIFIFKLNLLQSAEILGTGTVITSHRNKDQRDIQSCKKWVIWWQVIEKWFWSKAAAEICFPALLLYKLAVDIVFLWLRSQPWDWSGSFHRGFYCFLYVVYGCGKKQMLFNWKVTPLLDRPSWFCGLVFVIGDCF